MFRKYASVCLQKKTKVNIPITLIEKHTCSSRIISVGQSHPDRYLWQFFHVKWFEHVFGHDIKLVSVNIKLSGQIIFDWLHLWLLHSNWPRRQMLKKKEKEESINKKINLIYQVEHSPRLIIEPGLWYAFFCSSKHEHSDSFLHFNGSCLFWFVS